MRRLYMQKNKATGSRGMVATGWLCEKCNFSDIITRFKKSRTSLSRQHHALMCECQTCGTTHKKGTGRSVGWASTESNLERTGQDHSHVNLEHILAKLSNQEKRVDGLILINNLDDPSGYLGLVLGTFIWNDSAGDTRQIAKDVFTAHATDLQRNIIDSVWKESWKRKGWKPLHGKRFKQKVMESSIDIEQVFGMGIILNRRVTDSTFKAIEMIESPEIYIEAALEANHRLAETYADRAISEGNNELAGKYMARAIKGGNYALLGKYVDIKGQDAAELIMEQLGKEKAQVSHWDSWTLQDFYAALGRTGSPEAALFLINDLFCKPSYFNDKNTIFSMGNENSENSVIRAIAALPRYFEESDIVAALVSHMDNYEPLEFLVQHYKEPEENAALFREVMDSSGDYEKTKKFIREATGINSSYYKHYLLKKDSGIRKFLFDDDPALRLMGTSMGKSAELGEELEEYVFAMSFLDPEESVREGATELVKAIGSSKIATPRLENIYTHNSSGYENLERLIGYEDPRFLPMILKYIHDFTELNKKLIATLEKRFPDQGQILETLFQTAMEKAPLPSARNAVMIALDIDKPKSCDWIKDMMKITTGKDRAARKESVNRRLMFIDIFAGIATPEDIPYLQELMKKDRSPRAKRRLTEIMMKTNT